MSASRNRRAALRQKLDEPVTLSWVDTNGAYFHAAARCLDISERGLRVELRQPIKSGSYVSIKWDKYKLNASATVRNTASKGSRYQIGLEFSSAWKWKEIWQHVQSHPGAEPQAGSSANQLQSG